MKVLRPTNNKITGGYTDTHRAYDFAGLNLPDEVRAGMDGLVIETMNKYDRNWQANTANDPFKPASGTRKLLVADYGNYIKLKHPDGTFELHSHLKQNTVLSIGTKVTAGQIIARIGNTGNSTGPHLHSEYRTSQNINTPVEFIEALTDPLKECLSQHATLVSKLASFEQKEKDWIATEKRLKEEKDQAIREMEAKVSTLLAEERVKCKKKIDQFTNEVLFLAEKYKSL